MRGLNDGIADLMKVVKPDLAIIDGTMGRDMTKECCFPVGLLIVSQDPLAADAVCSRIMGFNPAEIEHLNLTALDGLGCLEEDQIQVVGESPENHTGRYPFSPPADPFTIAEKSGGRIEIIQGNPCCVCLNELGTVLHLFESRMHEMKDITILIGPKARPDKDQPDRIHHRLRELCG